MKTLDTLVKNGKKKNTGLKRNMKKALIGLATAGTALTYQPKADAEVVFSMEAKNSCFYIDRELPATDGAIQIYVYADNLQDEKPTSKVSWELEVPQGINFENVMYHNPYFTDIDITKTGPCDEFLDRNAGKTIDFFYGYPLDHNSVQVQKSQRSINQSLVPQNVIPGVSHRKGLLAVYAFDTFSQTNAIGPKTFKLRNTQAYAADGTTQATRTKDLSVYLINNWRDLEAHPHLLLDQHQKIPQIHTLIYPYRLSIETSADLNHWESIGTNNLKDPHGSWWLGFTVDDTQATNYPMRFYRAVKVSE